MDRSQSDSHSGAKTQNYQELAKVLYTYRPSWNTNLQLTLTSAHLEISSPKLGTSIIHGIKLVSGTELQPLPASCTSEIVKMKKSDGLEIWITYKQELGWILRVADKCRVFRDEKDLTTETAATESSSDVCLQVAELWFKTIQTMTKDMIKDLCKELGQFTLIGEFTGNPDRSNVIKYSRPETFFYAMVSNSKSGTILPPSAFFEFCEAYGLDCAEYDTFNKISSQEELTLELADISNKLKRSKITESEQGSILFVVLTRGKLQKVHGVSFAAALEFKAYQLIKEICIDPDFVSLPLDQSLQRFKSYFNELPDGEGTKLPQPLNFYLNIVDLARDTVQRDSDRRKLFNLDFGAFLLVLLDNLVHQTKITNETFAKSTVSLMIKNSHTLFHPKPQHLILKKLDISSRVGLDSPSLSASKPMVQEPVPEQVRPPLQKQTSSAVSKPQASDEQDEKPRQQHSLPTLTPLHPPLKVRRHENSQVLLPVVLPSSGLSTYFAALTKSISALNRSGSMPLFVRPILISWQTAVQDATESTAAEQLKMSVEGYQGMLAATSWQALVTRVAQAIAIGNNGAEASYKVSEPNIVTEQGQKPLQDHREVANVVLVDKAFSLESAQRFIDSVRASVEGGEGLRFVCLAKSNSGTNQQKISNLGLGIGPTALITLLARKLANTDSISAKNSAITQLLTAVKSVSGTTPNQQIAKEFGFDGFIGFPFSNVEWENEMQQKPEFIETIQNLADELQEHDHDSPSRYERLLIIQSNLQLLVDGLKNWWEIDNIEEPGATMYDTFLAKSLSTVYKKFGALKPRDTEASVPVESPVVTVTKDSSSQGALQTLTEETKEGAWKKKLVDQIRTVMLPAAVDALSCVRAYDPIADRDSLAIKSALLDKPSSWNLLETPWFVSSKPDLEPSELSIVAFAYIPSSIILALPRQSINQPSFLCFAHSSTSLFTQTQLTAMTSKLNCEGTLALDRAGPVEELTALRIDGSLVYVVSGSCTLLLE
jgi:hypothetical protein